MKDDEQLLERVSQKIESIRRRFEIVWHQMDWNRTMEDFFKLRCECQCLVLPNPINYVGLWFCFVGEVGKYLMEKRGK